MRPETFRVMAAHEDTHWWFVGRRAVVGAMLDRVGLRPEADILEAGCGTGGNLYMLRQRGSVHAFEPDSVARDLAGAKGPDVSVADGELPSRIPFPPDSFDLVLALDVLEHIEDDGPALTSLVAMARPGGAIVITVPAIQALWGSHDARLHHFRRYEIGRLRAIVREAGAEIEYETYFNTVLAPLAIGYRLAERLMGRDFGDQERMPGRVVNAVLSRLFGLEGGAVRHGRLPMGLSIGMIVRRPAPHAGVAEPRA